MFKRSPRAFVVPTLLVLLSSCALSGSRDPAAGKTPEPAAAWYVIENGRFVEVAAGRLPAAAPESFVPWTGQERVGALARLGGAVYAAVNGHGIARVVPGSPNRFVYFYDRSLFRGRTLRTILPEAGTFLCHVYKDSLLEAPGGAGDTGAPNLLRLRPSEDGFQVDFVRPPFQAQAPGWQVVSVAHGAAGPYWLEWKRSVGDRVEFAYTAYDVATGREKQASREEFRNSHGIVLLEEFKPRQGSAIDLLVARIASAARDGEYLDITVSGGAGLEHYMRLPEGSGRTIRQIPVFADAGRALALEPTGMLLEVAAGSAKVRTLQLPALPRGFVYSDLFMAGTTLVAAWEQADFFRVGRAGLLIKQDAFAF